MKEFRIAFCFLVCLAIGCSKPQPQKVAVAGVELTLPAGWKVASQKTSDEILQGFKSESGSNDDQLHGAWELRQSQDKATAILALLSSPLSEELAAEYAKDPVKAVQAILEAAKEDGTFAVRTNVGARPALRIEAKEVEEGIELTFIVLNFIHHERMVSLVFSTASINMNRIGQQFDQVIASIALSPD